MSARDSAREFASSSARFAHGGRGILMRLQMSGPLAGKAPDIGAVKLPTGYNRYFRVEK